MDTDQMFLNRVLQNQISKPTKNTCMNSSANVCFLSYSQSWSWCTSHINEEVIHRTHNIITPGLLIQNLIFHSAVTPWDFMSQFASRRELKTNLYLCQWYPTTISLWNQKSEERKAFIRRSKGKRSLPCTPIIPHIFHPIGDDLQYSTLPQSS